MSVATFDLQRAALLIDGTPTEKHVLLVLATRCNKQSQCNPGMPRIATDTGLSERSVLRAILQLERDKHITRIVKAGIGTTYTIHPRHSATPDSVSPLTVCPNTPDTVSPKQPVTPIIPQKATPSSVARASGSKVLHFRLPDDWKPSRFADGTVAREIIDRRGQEWARAALESFRAWAANADDKNGAGRKLDWQAAWVKWVIEQDNRDGRRPAITMGRNGQSASGHGSVVDSAERVIARHAARAGGLVC